MKEVHECSGWKVKDIGDICCSIRVLSGEDSVVGRSCYFTRVVSWPKLRFQEV
jgi:hypothetical protein